MKPVVARSARRRKGRVARIALDIHTPDEEPDTRSEPLGARSQAASAAQGSARGQGNVLAGAALVVTATAMFATLDTATKHLAMLYDVPLIAALRYSVHLMLVLAVFLPREGRRLFEVRRKTLVAVRGASIAFATLFAGLALQRIPVAEMVSIFYLGPIVVLLLSGPLLGEAPGWRRMACGVAGFAGVLLIVRPGGGLDPLGAGFALAAAGTSVVYQLLSSRLAANERPPAMQLYMAVVGLILFSLFLPWSLGGPEPGALELMLLPAIGALGFGGHYLLTMAYRQASAAALAPIGYVHLLWAGLLGWIVFGHVPGPAAMIGMALIAAGGAIAAMLSRRRT